MWFTKLIVQFFFSMDRIVYGFISSIYDLLITISRTTILSQGNINEFYQKVYTLLGIFMLFKVAFSLVTYVVNPDDFSDKNKGIGKIGQNIIISLCLLVLVPYAFNMAYELQTIILEDNILAKIILSEPDSGETGYLNTAGDTMAYTTLSAFFTPNTSINKLMKCTKLYTKKDDKVNLNEECFGVTYNETDETFEKVSDTSNTMYFFVTNGDITENQYYTYLSGLKNENMELIFRQAIVKSTTLDGVKEETFLFDYKYIFSTVVGVVIILILLGFCLDVALRSVKLAFLQIIAPIPIISYIDPKSGKDGIFKKWYKMCFSTFLSLFIRLLALYFAIYIISEINQMTDIVNGSVVTNNFVKIFIIVGVLMFAKQLPKILEGLGIKIDGDGKFSLNPLKKVTEGALGGKQLLGAGAAGLAGAAAMGANALSGFQNFRNSKGTGFWNRVKTAGRGLGSVVAGGVSATGRGLIGAGKGEKFGKNFTNSYSGAMQAKQSRADRISDDVGFGEMMEAKFTKTIGGHTTGEIAKSVNEKIDAFQKAYDTIKNAAIGSDSANWTSATGKTYKGAKEIQKLIEAMGQAPSADAYDLSTATGQADYQAALRNYINQKKELDDAMEERIGQLAARGNGITVNDGHGGANGGRAAQSAIDDAIDTMNKLQDQINKTGKSIDSDFEGISNDVTTDVVGAYKQSKGAKTQFAGSTEFQHSQDVERYAAKKGQK